MAPSQPTGSGTAIPAANIQGRQGVTYEYGVAVGEAVGQTRRGSGPSGRLPLSFGSCSSRRQGRCAGPGQASRTPHPEARTARLHTKYFVRHDQQLPVGRHALGKAGTSRGWRSLHKPTGPAELCHDSPRVTTVAKTHQSLGPSTSARRSGRLWRRRAGAAQPADWSKEEADVESAGSRLIPCCHSSMPSCKLPQRGQRPWEETATTASDPKPLSRDGKQALGPESPLRP